MNRRQDSPDQYGQEHYEHKQYGPSPQGCQRSDEQLREEISERLEQAFGIDSSDVTVEVLGGKVVLEGAVPNRYVKHAIEDLADVAPGVQDVDNRIRVLESAAPSGAAEVHGR
jgi:osmotically-inducible protein OsmY